MALFEQGTCSSCNQTACLLLESCSPLLGNLGVFLEQSSDGLPIAMSFVVGVLATAVVLSVLYTLRRCIMQKAASRKGMYTFGEAPDMGEVDDNDR